MITKEGTFTAIVDEIKLAAPSEWRKNAGPDDFEVCLHVVLKDDESQSDWWRGFVSEQYSNLPNKSTMREAEITLEALRSVGFEGEDFSQVEAQLLHKEIPITTKLGKANDKGKQYMNIYLGAGHGPVALEADEAMRRAKKMQSLFGMKAEQGTAAPTTPPPAQTTTAKPFPAKGSPFGAKK
jgi:hypothetical protein